MRENEFVLRGEGVILVFRGDKRLARQSADLRRDLFRKALGRVKPRSDGGAAERKLLQARKREHHLTFRFFDHISPAADLLRKRDGTAS